MHAPKLEFQFGGMHSSFAFKGNRPPELSFEFNYHDPPPGAQRTTHAACTKGLRRVSLYVLRSAAAAAAAGAAPAAAARPALLFFHAQTPRTPAAAARSSLIHRMILFCSLRFHVELYKV